MAASESLVDALPTAMFLASPAVRGVFDDHRLRLARELAARGVPAGVLIPDVTAEESTLLRIAGQYDALEATVPADTGIAAAHEARRDRIARVLAFSAAAHRITRIHTLRSLEALDTAGPQLWDMAQMQQRDERRAELAELERGLEQDLRSLEDAVRVREQTLVSIVAADQERRAAVPRHDEVVAALVARAEGLAELARQRPAAAAAEVRGQLTGAADRSRDRMVLDVKPSLVPAVRPGRPVGK